MIQFLKLNKIRTYFNFKRPMSFRKAFFISLLLHGLLFFGMAFLINIFTAANLNEQSIFFDLISTPTNIPPNLEDIKHDLPKSHLLPHKLVDQIEKNNPQPDIQDDEDISENFLNNLIMPASLNLPRIKNGKPKLMPAVLSMSHQQQKFLAQQANKAVDKLQKLNRSDSVFVWKHKKQSYIVKLHRKPATTITGLDEVMLEVTTREKGYNVTTKMLMRRMAFSNYAQFIDNWDPKVAVHNDNFRGRFHSNSPFKLSRNKGITPKFYGKVTTASYNLKLDNLPLLFDEQSVFIGGLERGAKEIRLPKTLLPFTRDKAVESSHVHVLTEDSWILFNKDGSYTWRIKSSPKIEHRRTIPQRECFFIVGKKKADLFLKGVVRGKVLVFAASNIIIDDDLVYARHPEVTIPSDDILGLVSQKDIKIAHPSVTGPGDLQICAAIYAKRKFRVPNIQGHGQATLHIYGSLSAGSITATEPRYATKIVYDKRLDNKRPPNFPMTDFYEIKAWEKQWKVKEQ